MILRSQTRKGPEVVITQRTSSDGKSSRHRVRNQITEMILSRKLKPGQRLVQERLAKEFSVAQGVVRESLLELSCCGLVDAVDNLGVFVSELDGAKVVEALEVREVLEGLAARLCCQRASREDIKKLDQLVTRIYLLGQEGKNDEAALLDRKFHHRIVETANSGTLQAVTTSHWTLQLVLKMSFDVEIVYEAHRSIIEAIEKNAPDEAEQLMRDHIRSARNLVEQQITEGHFVPEWLC